jgi:hypothetical protein
MILMVMVFEGEAHDAAGLSPSVKKLTADKLKC